MPFKILSLYFIFEGAMYFFDKWEITKHKNNIIYAHIDTASTYVFFGLIYYFLFKNKYVKTSILVSIILITVFSVVNAFFIQKYTSLFPTYTMMLTEALCIILAILLFNKMLLYPTEVSVVQQSAFWLNTSVIVYNSSLFFASAVGNYYSGRIPLNYYIIVYFWYGTIYLFYILLLIAILKDKKEVAGVNVPSGDPK